MQINRAMIAAGIAAAILIGLILLSPPAIPVQDLGDQGKTAVPPSPSVSPVVTVPEPVTPAPNRAGPAGPGDHWATVDPVADIHISRPGPVTVRGTTNVQPGDVLKIDFIANSMHPSPMEYHPDLWVSETANVTKGDGGVNRWSAEVRPEDFKKPDRWQVLITDMQNGWSIGGGSVNVTA